MGGLRRADALVPYVTEGVVAVGDRRRRLRGGEVRVCEALEISEANQRVLLHRARTRVRHALDEYLMAREAANP